MLDVTEVAVRYGTIQALKNVSISVKKSEIVTVVGANGAGKSTLLKTIAGTVKRSSGSIKFEGTNIEDFSAAARVKSGLILVPEGRQIFVSMTVEENLEMGAYIRRDDIAETMEQVYDLFPILREKRAQLAAELSGGQRQQVAVGRALMTKPEILMLDEPTAGVSPIVMDELFDRIIEVARAGIAILMVEQNAKQALNIADRGYVLVQGCNAYTGSGKGLMANPDVRKAFLGG